MRGRELLLAILVPMFCGITAGLLTAWALGLL